MTKYHVEMFDPERLSENDIDRIQLALVPAGTRVLEIGCATGYMTDYLRQSKGCFVAGVEKRQAECLKAEERCNVLFKGGIDESAIQKEIDSFVAATSPFDVVFMSQVVEHLACPLTVLEKAREWLTDSGILVVSTVNVAHWKSRLRLLAGKWEYEEYGLFDSTHLRFFTPHSLREELECAGFVVVDEKYSLDDLTPFPTIAGINLLTPGNLLRVIPFVGKRLWKWYGTAFKNLVGFQFVYACIKA
ncbi:MAG: class I SAM-dependent methyltransferase [Deltaproteobacteria bacterium]|nr:class I SAM-dependent methyltransferase [Deltaproteobacteria bacterium]